MKIATNKAASAERIKIPGLCSVILAVALSACTSTPTPDQMSRTAVETAPADLQLLCANAAASSAGVDSSRVLPMSSRRLDAKTFQVDLNVGGKTTNCIIDDTGNVRSVQAI